MFPKPQTERIAHAGEIWQRCCKVSCMKSALPECSRMRDPFGLRLEERVHPIQRGRINVEQALNDTFRTCER